MTSEKSDAAIHATDVKVKEPIITEQKKVKRLYDIIGNRGLYVSTNFDVFSSEPTYVKLLQGAGYGIPIIAKGSRAYTHPLLLATLTSLLNHGTMLITGAPGIGKTTGAEFAGHFFTGTHAADIADSTIKAGEIENRAQRAKRSFDDILAAEILGHPQLTEEKMVASYDLGLLVNKGEKKVIPSRFLECPVKIIDEGNRMPPDTLSILMKLVDTGKQAYGGQLLEAKKGPLFVTANYTDEGTFHFTPPFLDRFDVAAMVTSPQPWDLERIRRRGDEKLNGGLEKALVIPDGLELDFDTIRKQIREMPEDSDNGISRVSEFADFMYACLRFSQSASDDLARATKGNAWVINQDDAAPGHFTDNPFTYTLNELSVRTPKAMERYAKAFAWFNGDGKADVTHLKTMLPYLLWHKVQPTRKALAETPIWNNDRISFIKGLIGKVEAEYTAMRSHSLVSNLYAPALSVLRTGKIGKKELTTDEVRKVVITAVSEIGKTDAPWAINLASHVAAEYNEKYNGRE